jgi:hypothetical protein
LSNRCNDSQNCYSTRKAQDVDAYGSESLSGGSKENRSPGPEKSGGKSSQLAPMLAQIELLEEKRVTEFCGCLLHFALYSDLLTRQRHAILKDSFAYLMRQA